MRRREFLSVMGTAAAWPIAARAQQTDRVPRVAILMGYVEDDAEAKALLLEFTQALSDFGWIEGRNLRIDIRWAPGRIDLMRTCAKELVSLQPDVILADSTPVTVALKHETSSIPIVFAAVADPVGSGFVESLPRPGGNITGFSSLETSMASKWLELLTEIAPSIKDLFDEAGVTTLGGSRVLVGKPAATRDSTVVERLKTAGGSSSDALTSSSSPSAPLASTRTTAHRRTPSIALPAAFQAARRQVPRSRSPTAWQPEQSVPTPADQFASPPR
jgi:hypothetical protein